MRRGNFRAWNFVFAASVVLAAAAGISHSAFASGSTILKPVYEQYFNAHAAGDLDKIVAHIDPAAEFIDDKGVRRTAVQYLELMKITLPKMRKIRATFTLNDAGATTNRITVKVQQESHAELLTQPGNWVAVVFHEVSEDVWENKNGAWKLVLSKTLVSEMRNEATSQAPNQITNQAQFRAQSCALCTQHCTQMLIICNTGSSNTNEYLPAVCLGDTQHCSCQGKQQRCMAECEKKR